MWKKLGAGLAALVLCAGLTGCSGSKEYGEMKAAQEAVLSLTGGKLVMTAGYEKPGGSDRIVTEFVFRLTEAGTYSYCQTQFDRNNKPVYCEFSDGQKTEQWLIGKGWSDINAALYTPDEPHRYLQVLSTPLDKKAVRAITVTDEAGNRRYDAEMDPSRLNETVYTDGASELLEETVSLLLSDAGELLCYNDEARIRDVEMDEEDYYTLEMQLSEANMVTEIARPELRGYGTDNAASAGAPETADTSADLDAGK